jgi:hypothetical protein
MTKLGSLFLALSAATVAACSAQSGDPQSEAIGSVEARIATVPNGVGCVRILAGGAFSVSHDFTVTPAQSIVLPMNKLPSGNVTFSGMAFNSACSPTPGTATATWVASGVAAVVTPGVLGTVNLVFQPSTSENVNATFDDGTDGGVVATTWDPTWSLAGVAYSNANLSIASTATTTLNVRTVIGHATGKWYWEITATGGDGVSNGGGLGIVDANFPNNASYIGVAGNPSGLSFGYGSSNATTWWMTWTGATISTSPPPATSAVKAGNVYTFALDMTAGKLWVGQNGTWYNAGNPGTALNPAATGISGTVYPGVTFYGSSINAFTANFGASPFAYTVPAGFTAGF